MPNPSARSRGNTGKSAWQQGTKEEQPGKIFIYKYNLMMTVLLAPDNDFIENMRSIAIGIGCPWSRQRDVAFQDRRNIRRGAHLYVAR
jgi:hypothetical protein